MSLISSTAPGVLGSVDPPALQPTWRRHGGTCSSDSSSCLPRWRMSTLATDYGLPYPTIGQSGAASNASMHSQALQWNTR